MKNLLVARDLKPYMMTAMSFLERAEISVSTAATNDELLKMHLEKSAHLLITRLDTPGLACETLVHTVRRGEHLRAVSIIILCDDSPVHRVRGSRCGANAVLSLNTDPGLFAEKVQDLLNVAPRRHYRVILNMAVESRRNNQPFMCTSENISTNGLLIRTPENLEQNDRIACSFFLPDGKRISANGEIVRAVKQTTSSDMNRYGIRFVALAQDAESAIASFVDNEISRLSGDPPGASLVA